MRVHRLNPKQDDFVASTARFSFYVGGVGAGKTYTGAAGDGAEQRQQREQMLATAVARMRHVQQQAWADHDADDERERSVLALVLGQPAGVGDAGESVKRVERGRGAGGGRVLARYQSQRAHYLRVILDAEREIARLCGLYEGGLAVDGAVVFRIERVGQEGAAARAGAVLDSTGEGL